MEEDKEAYDEERRLEKENERGAQMEENKKAYDEKRRWERENERAQMEEDKEAYDERRRLERERATGSETERHPYYGPILFPKCGVWKQKELALLTLSNFLVCPTES